MKNFFYLKAARCLQLGILAVSFLSAQTISEQDLQYLWKLPHEGRVKVVDVKTKELKNNRSVFFNSWYPDNPNRFYHSYSSYSKVKNEFSKLMSTSRNESVFIQKQYDINSRELMIESSENESVLTTLALDSLYNEEALWVLIPEMFINNITQTKIWLLPTLSKSMDFSNEGIYSEFIITNQIYLINDIECIKVNWLYKEQTLGIYVSNIGIPKIIQLELPDLSLFELKKMDLKIQN